jgi:hypothetical protein
MFLRFPLVDPVVTVRKRDEARGEASYAEFRLFNREGFYHHGGNPSSFIQAPAPAFLSQNRQFEFDKNGQLFIRTHNETLSVVAMRVSNEVQVGKAGSNLNI